MILYLSSFDHNYVTDTLTDESCKRLNGLLSFELLTKKGIEYIPKVKRFMLDSGAFSFITRKLKSKKDQNINWDEYIDKYCNFVVQNDVKLFFELDVDFLVGYDKVKEFRKQIIKKTNRLPIPVWHITRGKEDFERMCDEYPYVALGGMVSKETNRAVSLELMSWLVDEAHKRGSYIHGLGFTNPNMLDKIHFDSVDSSSWAQHSFRGMLNYMENGKMKICEVRRTLGLTEKEFFLSNFEAWLHFSDYAESHF